jgi:rare lipoprotein A
MVANYQYLSKISKLIAIFVAIIHLAACSSSSNNDGPPKYAVNLDHVKEPVPKKEPKSKYGNPSTYKVFGKQYKTLDHSKNFTQTGKASWYGTKFHGRRTSSGEPYDMLSLTGAHKTLPLPTYAKVTNTDNNKSIIIKINDRGPFHDDRILDLSYAAAAKLGVLTKGTANIKLTAINPDDYVPNDINVIKMQIGVFSERQNAQKLVTNVSKIIKHPIKITNEHQGKKAVYKVHIGPFPADKIEQIKTKLASINISNPITVAVNSKI